MPLFFSVLVSQKVLTQTRQPHPKRLNQAVIKSVVKNVVLKLLVRNQLTNVMNSIWFKTILKEVLESQTPFGTSTVHNAIVLHSAS